MKCGSLFTGILGLDEAVCEFFDAELAWVSEIEKGPCEVIHRHHPDVPNLGDVTKVEWSEVEPVDIICGGYPCQPFSKAGKRRGEADPRHLWPYFKDALRILRPRYAVLENVAGHLRLGFDTVLADLAELGFDARWTTVRASDVGAPHRRERLFCLGTADADLKRHLDGEVGKQSAEPGHPPLSNIGGSDRPLDAHANGERFIEHGQSNSDPTQPGLEASRRDDLGGRDQASPHSSHNGHERAGEARHGGPGPAHVDWGAYGPAIERWELVMGRSAPHPVDEKQRLAPELVEWMMGRPAGYTKGLTRAQRLKALGNSVIPHQAYYALNRLAS